MNVWDGGLEREKIVFVDNDVVLQGVVKSSVLGSMVVGLDMEWKPISRETTNSSHTPKVSIIQMSCQYSRENYSETTVFIIDLLSVSLVTLGEVLHEVFQKVEILKLGYCFEDDFKYLISNFSDVKLATYPTHIWPFVEIGALYQRFKSQKQSLFSEGKKRDHKFSQKGGLSAIVEETLGKPLCKDLQCSNWENRPLSNEQLYYAALDAFCLLAVFEKLSKEMTRLSFISSEKSIPGMKSVPFLNLLKETEDEVMVEQFFSVKSKSVLRSIQVSAVDMVLETSELLENLRLEKSSGLPIVKRNSPEELGVSEVGKFKFHWEEIVRLYAVKLTAFDGTKKRKPRKKKGIKYSSGNLASAEIPAVSGPFPWDPSMGGNGIPKFLCDGMIEGLARHLRCVGVDTSFSSGLDARELYNKIEAEGRVLLTRDRKIVQRRIFPANCIYCVKSLSKADQLKEVIGVFKLKINKDRLLSRCIRCNGDFIQTPIGPEEAKASAPPSQNLPPCALENILEFWQCGTCKHLYWEGSQFDRALGHFSSMFNGSEYPENGQHTSESVGEITMNESATPKRTCKCGRTKRR